MFIENTRKNENTRNFINVKVRRSYTVGESKKAVLFEFETNDFESYYVWINKNAIFTSIYTDILDISLKDSEDFLYSIYKEGNNDWKKPDTKVSGKKLKEEILKIYDIQEINK